MKKLLTAKYIVPAIALGVIALPSAALAQFGADDVNKADDKKSSSNAASQLIDGRNTNLQSQETTVDGVKIENEVALPDPSITTSSAITIAKQQFPDKTVAKVEVENENGAVVFSIRFTDQSRVDVRASDGQIVRTKDAAVKNSNKVEKEDNDSDDSDEDQDKSRTSNREGSGRSHRESDDD